MQAWGRVLATGCRSGRIARIQVLERTITDSGSGLEKWWSEQGTDDGSWVATTYRELIGRAGPAGERHICTLSLSLDMKAAARQIRSAGRGLRGAAEVLRQEMTTLTTALRAADLDLAEWHRPGQLAIMLRTAYDPQVTATLDRAGNIGEDLATAGPVAVEESWDRLRSDSAWHAVVWVSEWPRSLVFPGFLSPLVLAGGIRRAFTLLYDPVRGDQAARDVRKRKTEYISDQAQRRRIGQIEDAAQSAELDDVIQQEQDLVRGHGILRFTGLIAVSAPTSEELDAAVSAIQQAAVQASCETRPLVGQDAADRKAAQRAQAAQERAEARSTRYLPRAGEPGPAALRTPLRFRVRAHQDTSATLRGAYPFLAEGGLGPNGIFIGTDMYSGGSFVLDPFELYRAGIITAPNMVIAGIVGAGKSALIKSLYIRSIAFGRRVYLPCDPKGEHTHISEAVGGKAIRLGHGSGARLNPLDEGYRPAHTSDAEWASMLAARRRDLLGALAETVLQRHLGPLEHTAIDAALADAVRDTTVPTLPAVVDRILNPAPGRDTDLTVEDGREVGHALRRLVSGDLAGLFDGPSTVEFDPSLPMMSLDLSQVVENASLVSVLMTCASAWMEAALLDPTAGRRLVIYDEAWRLMSQPSLLRRMDSHWRLARHYGISNALIFHKLSDLETVGDQGSAMRSLAASLLANAEIRVVYRQASDQLTDAATALGLTGTEQALLPGLGIGQGLWRVKDRAYLVQHQMHPEELRMFDTRSRLVDMEVTGSSGAVCT